MSLETDFKRITGEDISGVNDEIIGELFEHYNMVHYPVDWNKVAEATKVLLDEGNFDRNVPESLMFNENE